jgi:lipopolysaccharide/colanic/teichoic acid biosynthesis glycosyltransferase
MATITTGLSDSIISRAAPEAARTSFYVRYGKRLFDVAAALAGLAISSPVLIFCALLVRLTSRGPVLFRQTRVGYLGRAFTLVKFRTMKQGAEALGSAVVVNGDPRLTPVGAFLRRTKLDEWPQLINVLWGEMSFVGPRPRVPSEVDLDNPKEWILLTARPGVTSFASVHHHMEADYCSRQADPQTVYRTRVLPQKLSLDAEYLQNPTFLLDLKLIVLTLLLVCSPGRSLAARLRISRDEVRALDRGAHIAFDFATYMGAAWLAYTLRYEAGFNDFYRNQMWLFIAFVPPLRVLSNRWLRVYDMMWRYVNLVDVFLLAVALAPVTLLLLALRLWLPSPSWGAALLHVPLSVTTLEYLIALSAGVGLRSLRRMVYVLQHHYQPLPEGLHRVLILGAGLLGLNTAVDMHQYPQMHLVGFVDDDPTKHRRLLAGCRVLGNSENLEALCACHKVTDLVICAKSIDLDRILELSKRCSDLGVKLHLFPGLDRLLRAEGILPLPTGAHLSIAGDAGFATARE